MSASQSPSAAPPAIGASGSNADRKTWGDARTDSAYDFTKEDGQPIHPQAVSRSFEQALMEGKLPRIRLHDLRHTHATLALKANVHPKVVSERLGHATVSITLDTYSHAVPAMQEEAAERIAGLVVTRRQSLPVRESRGGVANA